MKITLFFLSTILTIIPVSGQFRFGIQGGANVTSLIEKNFNHDNVRNLYRLGYNVGPVAEFRPGRFLTLKTALILETKGNRARVSLDTATADLATNLVYLDLPVLLKGNIRAGSFTFFLEAGPYTGIGLTGKATADINNRKSSQDIKWGSGVNDEFKRLDFGGIAGAGAEWNRFYLEGTFAFGLANIFPVREIDYNIHHRIFSLRGGYFFGK
jgi:hypothetical protein